jgi:flagellar basal-body rod protein FlgF
MESPTYVTLSAQAALQSQLNIVANNIANSSTAGYKADRTLFQAYEAKLKTPGNSVSFVQDRATYIDRTAGALQTTDNPLDLAIKGDGYFAVQTAQGRQYTRDGKLQIGQDGTLQDVGGRPVLTGDGSPIQLPANATNITIKGDGAISLLANGVSQQVGQLGLFRAGNQVGIRKAGSGLIDGTGANMSTVDPGDTSTRIVQGSIEESTVQPVVELTRMQDLTQAYDRLQKLIGADNDRTTQMIEQLGKTN